MSTAISVWFI